jgi:phage gpG-like protein
MCREHPLVSSYSVGAGFISNKAEIERISAKYRGYKERAINPTLAMEEIANYLQSVVKKNFESEGRRKGGSWPALKKDTIRKKLQLVGAGGGVRLQGGYAFGGGFFIRPKGSSGVTGVFRPTGGAIHVYEPVRLTDRLYNAAIGKTSESIRVVEKYSAVIGVKGSVEYAAVQKNGGGNNIPARDYLMIDESDRIDMLHIVEDWIFQTSIGGQRRPKGMGGYVY